MKKILIDTSVIIDFLRRKNKEQTLFYALAKNKSGLYISIITHTEFFEGKSVWENENARNELNTIFSGLRIFPLEIEISQKAGEIRAHYKTDLLDAIIAATSLITWLRISHLQFKAFPKNKRNNFIYFSNLI